MKPWTLWCRPFYLDPAMKVYHVGPWEPVASFVCEIKAQKLAAWHRKQPGGEDASYIVLPKELKPAEAR